MRDWWGSAPSFGFSFRAGSTDSDHGWTTAVDAAGNLYVAGDCNGTVDFDPGPGIHNLSGGRIIGKYTSGGALCWARSVGRPGENYGNNYGNGIAVGADGSVYATGSFNGTSDFDPGPATFDLVSAGGCDIVVLKLDSAGNFVWANREGGAKDDLGYGIALAGDGGVYSVGCFSGTVDFDPGPETQNLTSAGSYDIFVSKVDSAGNFGWARRMGGSGTDYGCGIALAADGSIYTTGYFQGTADFDPESGVYNLRSAGGNDIFVAKLNSVGNFVWASRAGGSRDDYGYAIALAPDESVCSTGSFRGTVDFDPARARSICPAFPHTIQTHSS